MKGSGDHGVQESCAFWRYTRVPMFSSFFSTRYHRRSRLKHPFVTLDFLDLGMDAARRLTG